MLVSHRDTCGSCVLTTFQASSHGILTTITSGMLCQVASVVSYSVTPWTVACQAPLPMGILQARILEWVAMPSSRGSSQSRDRTCVSCGSCNAGEFFTTEPLGKPSDMLYRQGNSTEQCHDLLGSQNQQPDSLPYPFFFPSFWPHLVASV